MLFLKKRFLFVVFFIVLPLNCAFGDWSCTCVEDYDGKCDCNCVNQNTLEVRCGPVFSVCSSMAGCPSSTTLKLVESVILEDGTAHYKYRGVEDSAIEFYVITDANGNDAYSCFHPEVGEVNEGVIFAGAVLAIGVTSIVVQVIFNCIMRKAEICGHEGEYSSGRW